MVSHSCALIVTLMEYTPMNELLHRLKQWLVRRYHAKLRCGEGQGELGAEY
jgi:hypothetical protein